MRVRRTQAERREATVAALLEAARELFAQDGFAATSLDAVASKARVTKGAVYHHFASKQVLFEAVFAGEVARLSAALATVYARKRDPWDAFAASCRAYLEECLAPDVQRIVLIDAPAAIGWETMRRLEAPLLDMMQTAISRAVEAGRIVRRPTASLAHFLFGALCEMAMVVARADDPQVAHRQAVAELGRVMDGLAAAR